MNEESQHTHVWREKNRVEQPNANGIYVLKLWDSVNLVSRKVPSAYYECACGDSLISPLKEKK